MKVTHPAFGNVHSFFELMVDVNVNNKKWVMYGGSGTYMIGKFDGKFLRPKQANTTMATEPYMLLRHSIIFPVPTVDVSR